jgi:hypothetical protein
VPKVTISVDGQRSKVIGQGFIRGKRNKREDEEMIYLVSMYMLIAAWTRGSGEPFQSEDLHQDINAGEGASHVEFALIAHISFKGEHGISGGDEIQAIFGNAQGEPLATPIIMEHDALDAPFFGDAQHHLAF